MEKIKIYHDDDQMDVVDKISDRLKEFGLTIVSGEGGDGWVEYQIVQITK